MIEVFAEPFEDSRRLTGSNLYFPGTGAALETARGLAFDDATLDAWRRNVQTARQALGWPQDETVIRRHRTGASLAFATPADQLYAATEVNEWAWWSAVAFPFSPREQMPFHAPGFAAIWDKDSAIRTLCAAARAESRPRMVELMHATAEHGLPFLADDDEITVGEGTGSRSWFIDELPAPAEVPWPRLHAVPTALVTGSNGKTTTVRLLAAMATAHGWRTAHSCTDGVYFEGAALETGDFSGPTGARTALRQSQAQAAILETARGGMLRRGLAIAHADAAIVTNIAADHFGEYGIHDLDDLAAVKLTVARAIDAHGLLALNADDPVLLRQARSLTCPLGWFALDFDLHALAAHRERGGPTCGVRDGRLLLSLESAIHDLGAVAAMPLALHGRAAYNIANLAGAALTASALGIEPRTIAAVAARFGAAHADNPGRLQQWRFGDCMVFVDYAHNPDGLRGLLQVACGGRDGRLALVLGQAGNREDADIRQLVGVAHGFQPALVVLKDIGGDYLRGRAPGEIAALMRQTLLDLGLPAEAIVTCLEEAEAARIPLAWARDGDTLVLPIHEPEAREHVVAMLERMAAQGWLPGQPLP